MIPAPAVSSSGPRSLFPVFTFAVPDDLTRQRDYTKDGVRRSLGESLARLGLDRVGIAFVHHREAQMELALAEAIPALIAWPCSKSEAPASVGNCPIGKVVVAPSGSLAARSVWVRALPDHPVNAAAGICVSNASGIYAIEQGDLDESEMAGPSRSRCRWADSRGMRQLRQLVRPGYVVCSAYVVRPGYVVRPSQLGKRGTIRGFGADGERAEDREDRRSDGAHQCQGLHLVLVHAGYEYEIEL